MTWLSWVLLIGILGGAFWVWRVVYDPKNGVTGCCGCGQCAASGECVLRGKKAIGKGEPPS